jgi:hypothetical protein
MAHRLTEFKAVTVSFRYQCGCEGKEVLQISVVMGENEFNHKERFHQIMEAAYLDVQTEIQQHLKG